MHGLKKLMSKTKLDGVLKTDLVLSAWYEVEIRLITRAHNMMEDPTCLFFLSFFVYP